MYLVLIVFGFSSVLIPVLYFVPLQYKPIVLFILALFFMIPGRISQYYYQKLYKGIRLFGRDDFQNSILLFQEFQKEITRNPWKKKLLWMTWSIYTVDVEAMVHFNLGSAYLNAGNIDEAEVHSTRALELDNQYPLPHVNLAMVEWMRENKVRAAEHLKLAADLGYRGTTMDQLINKTQSIYAKIQSGD